MAQHRRQVLVIDNCPPDLHRRLSEVCGKAESKVSLLTIEYDVREDQPEGTNVYELQPSSDDLIEKLLLRRVEGLSQVNAASIAKLASGNARVALALAKTIESGESVASLNDADLFERLFRQRHESSSSLLLSAQACSLPYSFQGEDLTTDQDSEISKLAAVVGKDIRALHTDIAELRRRDLIQKRGVWRALLPHAIANRLAAMALENIFPTTSSSSSRQLHRGCYGRFLDGSDIYTPPRPPRRSSIDGSPTTGCSDGRKTSMKIEGPCWLTWLRSILLRPWMRLNARLSGVGQPENN